MPARTCPRAFEIIIIMAWLCVHRASARVKVFPRHGIYRVFGNTEVRIKLNNCTRGAVRKSFVVGRRRHRYTFSAPDVGR